MDYYAEWYVYPYFSQTWRLFVPPPTTNYQLFAGYGGDESPGEDIFGELIIRHRENRLSGAGPLLLAFSNSIHYFEKNTPLQDPLNGPVKDDRYFDMLRSSVHNYLRLTRAGEIGRLKIRLVVRDISSGQAKVYYD